MPRNIRSKSFGTGSSALDLAAGLIPGVRTRNAFGINRDIDNGVAETIWNVGGLWAGPTVAQQLEIVSDNAADDAATGEGAWELTIVGLESWDADGVTVEKITMDGTTVVDSVNSYVLCCFVTITNHGSTGVNVGTITVTAKTDETIQHQIDPGVGSSQTAVCGIPAGKTMFVTNFHASILQGSGSGEVDIQLKVDRGVHLDAADQSFTTVHSIGLRSNGTSSSRHEFDPYLVVVGPAVIQVQATPNANNFQITGGFDLVVTDNSEMHRLRQARKLNGT